MKKDFLSLVDIDRHELEGIVSDAMRLKQMKSAGTVHEYLKGKSLGMIFEKASTRTRVSFEVGMTDLGGRALKPHDLCSVEARSGYSPRARPLCRRDNDPCL